MLVFLLGALIVFSINAGLQPEETVTSRVMMEAIGPFQKAVTNVRDGIGRIWSNYFGLVQAARHNEELKKEVAFLRQELVNLEEERLANRRLRALLKLGENLPHSQVAAQVVGVDPTGYSRIVIIDKGKNHGVLSQMAVVSDQGVVGRTIWASSNYAKVLLLIDPNAAVDVLVQRSRARGMVEGGGSDTLRLKYVMTSEDVQVGDVLLSTGVDGIFPKGLQVGRIRALGQSGKGIFLKAEVDPAVQFDDLEEVMVILSRRELEEDD